MSLLFKLFYGCFTLMSERPILAHFLHITHYNYNLIVGILIAVSNIISFLISSYCASGCHCLLWLVSVRHPMLTLAKRPTMTAPKKYNSHSLKQTQNTFMCLASLVQCTYFRRFTTSQSHLQQIPPISFILPQLCAHDAFKIIKQLVTELFFHSLCTQIIPPLHPLSSPPAGSGAPGHRCPQHPRRRPRRGAAPQRRCGRCQPRGAAVCCLRRRRARRRQRLAPLRGSPPPTPTAVGETAICGVKSVSFIFYKIV